jgi:hypothetical protein
MSEPAVEPVIYRIATYACPNCDVLTTIGESTHPFTGRPLVSAVPCTCPVSGHAMFLVDVREELVEEAPHHEVHARKAAAAQVQPLRRLVEEERPAKAKKEEAAAVS